MARVCSPFPHLSHPITYPQPSLPSHHCSPWPLHVARTTSAARAPGPAGLTPNLVTVLRTPTVEQDDSPTSPLLPPSSTHPAAAASTAASPSSPATAAPSNAQTAESSSPKPASPPQPCTTATSISSSGLGSSGRRRWRRSRCAVGAMRYHG